jgi:hypothetical protein
LTRPLVPGTVRGVEINFPISPAAVQVRLRVLRGELIAQLAMRVRRRDQFGLRAPGEGRSAAPHVIVAQPDDP